MAEIKKTYTYEFTYTDIDNNTASVVKTGSMVYNKGIGIDYYDVVSTTSDKLKKPEVIAVDELMNFLSNQYATTGTIVEIKLTFKP